MSGAVYEMLIPYDILVAAVREALPGIIPGWIEEPLDEETLTGCTVFRFSQRQLGDDLGEVRVRKVGERRTELRTRGPKELYSHDLTLDEREELRQRRETHFDTVIQAMFNRLYHDMSLMRELREQGNILQIDFMAWLAGEKKRVDSDTVAEPQVSNDAVVDLVRKWKATKVSDLELMQGLDELGFDVLKLPGVQEGTSGQPAKLIEYLGIARTYFHAKSWEASTQSDVGDELGVGERTVRRAVALYKAIEKLA